MSVAGYILGESYPSEVINPVFLRIIATVE